MKKKLVKGLSMALSTVLCVGMLSPLTTIWGAASSSTSSGTTRMSVHDPSIFYDEKTDEYYIFGSHLAQASSSDLRRWSAVGTQGYNNATLYASENVEGVYYIQNVNSGLYLDVEDGSAENGANIRQWGYNGSDAQKFKIVSAGKGLYYILTGASGYTGCVDVENGSADNGTNIMQWEYWGGDMQKYRIVQQPDNSYAILTNASDCGSALDMFEWSTEDGGNVEQWAFGGYACQKWNLIEAESGGKSSQVSTGEVLENALASSFLWAGYNDQDCSGGYAVWAPDVIYNEDYVWNDGSKGAYMMYYSASSTYIRSCIGYAVSKSIEGPYSYVDTVVYSGFTKSDNEVTTTSTLGTKTVNTIYTNTNIPTLIKDGELDAVRSGWFNSNGSFNNSLFPNAIDPTLVYDESGNLWMTYGSWSGGIYILQIDTKTGQPIYPGSNSGNTDGYFGKRIAGGYTKSGEAPYIVYDAESGYYYLYVTYGWLGVDGGYHIRMYRSKTIDGTYVDAAGNKAVFSSGSNQSKLGVKTFGNYDFSTVGNGYKSGGHNSAFIDEDGARYLVYHTRFNTGNEYHEVRVHQQFLNEDKWPVTAVYEFLGSKISKTGYKMGDMAGTYEFVNHGLDASTANVGMLETSTVKLTTGGKITGDYTGTWSYTEGTYYCTMEIDGVTYKGVFFKQKDETSSHKAVMTFTLIGENNQSIWGTKTVASTLTDNDAETEAETVAPTTAAPTTAAPTTAAPTTAAPTEAPTQAPTSGSVSGVAHTGSVTIKGSNWWASKDISKSDLLGDVDPADVTAIKFTGTTPFWVGYNSTSGYVQPSGETEYTLTDVSLDNYYLQVCLSKNDNVNYTFEWEIYTESQSQETPTVAPTTAATTAAPTTVAPTTAAPTEAPTTAAPTTAAPTEAPTTSADSGNETSYVHNFTTDGTSSSFLTFSSKKNLSSSKGSFTYDGLKLTKCLKVESATTVSFTTTKANAKLIIVVQSKSSGTLKVTGAESFKISNLTTDVELREITLGSAGMYTISKNKAENYIYYIKVVE